MTGLTDPQAILDLYLGLGPRVVAEPALPEPAASRPSP